MPFNWPTGRSKRVSRKCEGKALSVVSLEPARNGLECWRQLKELYEGRGGSRVAALLRGILLPPRGALAAAGGSRQVSGRDPAAVGAAALAVPTGLERGYRQLDPRRVCD